MPQYIGHMNDITYWAMYSFDSIWIVGIHSLDTKITAAQFHLPEPSIVCCCFAMMIARVVFWKRLLDGGGGDDCCCYYSH